jgi:hypothetical protein
MKSALFFTAALLISSMAFAEPVRFICDSGNESEFMVLDENSVEFRGHTFINMMPVDEEMTYRGYSFVNDPWESLLVTTPMVKGEEGYADITISDLQTGESETKGYVCTPAE